MDIRTAITIITESELPDDWDLGGAWITSEGQTEACDHGTGRHHADIALDIFDEYIETNDDGEYDDCARDAAQDLAYDEGWVRINTRGHRSISIEWKVPLTNITKKALLNYLIRMDEAYQSYEVEDMGKFQQFDDPRVFIGYIRRAK